LIFQYEPKNISYKLVRKFDINGDPSEFFINNAGTRIVTIGQKGSFNKGQVAAVFDTTGSLLKEWTLKQVFNVKNIFDDERVMKFSTSSGGISWRGRAMWSHKKNCVRIDFPYHIDLDKLVLTQHFDSDYYLIDVDKLEIIIKSQPKKSKIIK